jgi:hypothetical protein
MKKSNNLKIYVSITAIILTSFISTVNAQESSNHVYHVNTWYMVTGMDSAARAERNAILKEYHQKVTMKNELIIHSTTMTHMFSEDSREFVTINEFANWNDIVKAGDRDDELTMKAWPDAKQRTEFFKKMNSYFTYHKDAVYSGLPSLIK